MYLLVHPSLPAGIVGSISVLSLVLLLGQCSYLASGRGGEFVGTVHVACSLTSQVGLRFEFARYAIPLLNIFLLENELCTTKEDPRAKCSLWHPIQLRM